MKKEDFKKIQEMDDIICELEIASEKTKCMIQDVMEEYFSLTEKSGRERCFNRAQVKNRIALDNILEVEVLVQKIIPIFNVVFNETKPENL